MCRLPRAGRRLRSAGRTMHGLITIDGSRGALGGQGLRTSLALAMALYAAFRMVNIRAHRAKPGMRPTSRGPAAPWNIISQTSCPCWHWGAAASRYT